MPESAIDERASTVFYEVTLRRLSEQLDNVRGIDSKVASLFGVASGILPVIGAILAIGDAEFRWYSWLLLALGVVAYLSLLYFCYRAYQVSDFSFRPNIGNLRTYSEGYSDEEMRWWVANECATSIEHNEPIIQRKAHALFVAVALLPVQAVFLLLAALVGLL